MKRHDKEFYSYIYSYITFVSVMTVIAIIFGIVMGYRCSLVDEWKTELIKNGANPDRIVCNCECCEELSEDKYIEFKKSRENQNEGGGIPFHARDHGAGLGF